MPTIFEKRGEVSKFVSPSKYQTNPSKDIKSQISEKSSARLKHLLSGLRSKS